MAYINKAGKLEGLITIQKRTKEALEDDIAIGAMLAFHRGNDVLSETAQGFKWCPVSGEYGRTQCGVTAITAAHTWAGLSRRKVTIVRSMPMCIYARERVLFIGTQFSILYTFMYSPA